MTAKSPKSTAFKPKQYSQEFIAISNTIHRTRHTMEWQMEDMVLNLDCSPVPVLQPDNNNQTRYLHIRLGTEKAVLCLPLKLVNLVLDSFGNGKILSQDSSLSPLLLTLGLEPAIEEIEEKLNLDVSLDVLATDFTNTFGSGLEFKTDIKNQSFKVQVFCELKGLKLISRLLSSVNILHYPMALKTQVKFQIGKTRLPLSDIQSLEQGDIIVLDRTRIDPQKVNVIINAGLAYQGYIQDNETIQIISQPRQYYTMDEMDNIDDDEHEHHVDHDISLGALQVNLSFELGRQTVSFDELSSITEGYSFTMPSQIVGGVTILANGQPIGKGEITQIGELTGVRVTRLFGNGQ